MTGAFLGFVICTLAILFQPAPTPALAQGTEPCNVYLDPGAHVFEVPEGVTEIEATVFGAQGGDVLGTSTEFGDGGLGGGATDVTIPVTPGELLEIVVGGAGNDSAGSSAPDPLGGFNGGGDGAVGSAHTSATGGGASQINRGATTLIIVGGGGGGAHGGDGGDGGLTGTDGTRLPGSTPGSTGGQAGGAGGAGGEGGDAGPGTADDQDGGDGAAGEGGDGGGHPTSLPVDGGGGGGGGFVGGGGGGGGPGNGGAGGGGGSSFDSTGTATFETGVRTGDGLVTLTYDCSAVPEPLEACVTFDEAGTESFVVPQGLTEIFATVYGAEGGSFDNGTPSQAGAGGLGGGAANLPISVTPGETLDIVVGGAGGDATNTTAGVGGVGGGGEGANSTFSDGAGGGGASEILRGTDQLVIGGGGGGGARGRAGGDGGQLGENGATGASAPNAPPGGGFSGGNGGLGGGGGSVLGGNGSPGQGGDGGVGAFGGGGGGAGAMGGGGGAGSTAVLGAGSGGGGGSSAHSLGQVPVTWQTGVEEGDGRVELAFDCADLGITKDATLVDEDTIEYTVTVENLGPNDATGVVATDPLPEQVTYDSDDCGGSADASGWTWTIGDLDSGLSVTCVITLTADEFGQIDNTASVDGDQADLNQDNNEDPASVFVPSADLELEKTAEPAIVDPSGQVTWTLTVTNNGPDPSTGSTVTDTLPASITNVQSSDCEVDGQTVTCDVGPLDVDGTASFEVTGTAPSTSSTCFDNAGSVTGDEADPDPDNNTDAARACTPPVADLELVKSAPATVDPGGQVTWALTVTNNGPNASSGSTVTDTLPASITNVQSSDCEVDGQTVTCDVGPLDVDGSASFEVMGTAPSTSATCFENDGSVAGVEDDPVLDNNGDSVETCTPPAADLELTKSAPATVDPAGQVTWTLTVTNHGPDASTGSTVTDTLPASITNVQSSDCDVDGQTVTCDVGPLAVDGSASFEVTGTAPSTSGTCFDNDGSVTGTEADPVPDNDADSVETCTPPVADLSLAKTADAVVEPGGQVTWTLTVTNEGPNASTGSTVTDTLPPEVTNVQAQTAGCTVQDNEVSCALGALAVSGSTDIVLTGNAPSTSSTCFENAGSVEGSEGDPVLANNDATVETCTSPPEPPPPSGKPKLKVNKRASDDEARPGEVLSYRIVVRNKGRADARRVRVCDKLPNGQTVLSAPGADKSSDKRVCWKLKRLKAGAKRKFKIVTQIKTNTKAGDQKNKAIVKAANGRGSRDAAEVDVQPVGGPCPSLGSGLARC